MDDVTPDDITKAPRKMITMSSALTTPTNLRTLRNTVNGLDDLDGDTPVVIGHRRVGWRRVPVLRLQWQEPDPR